MAIAADRTSDLFIDGDIGKPEYQRRKAEIEAEFNKLVVPRQDQVMEAGNWLQSIGDLWPHATSEEKREIALCLFDRIYVDMSRGKVVRVRPHSEFVPLFRQIETLVEMEDCFESREIATGPGQDSGQEA
jgi:hypothetical protein